MNDEIKQIILAQEKMTVKDYRKIYDEIDRLKKLDYKTKYEIKQAQKEGNDRSVYILSQRLNKDKIAELKAKAKDEIVVSFNKKQAPVKTKLSVLKKQKDPEKYIRDKYVNQTLNKIKKNEKNYEKTKKQHYLNSNKGLQKLLLKGAKDNKKVKQMIEENEQKQGKEKFGFDSFLKDLNEKITGGKQKEYIPLTQSSGTTINITFI